MAKISVKIKGLKEVEKLLGKQGQQRLLREISEEMEVKANEIRNKAKYKAPKDQSYLRGQIKVDVKYLRWVIVALAEYSGYMEFGTKTKVNVPPEMREEADKFRNSGGSKKSYEQFKAAI